MSANGTFKPSKKVELRRKKAEESAARAEAREQELAREAAQKSGAESRLKEMKAYSRDPMRVFDRLVAGEDVTIPSESGLAIIARRVELLRKDKNLPGPNLAKLKSLVRVCWDRTDMLRGRNAAVYAPALVALAVKHRTWINDAESWIPKTHNTYRQFHALVRYLVAQYDVPTFMNSAWLEGPTQSGLIHQDWFVHIGRGANLRTAPELPVALTKKQAHVYMQAPDDFDAVSAIRYAQVLDLGGDERLTRSFVATTARDHFAHDGFWQTVIRWFVANPMLDPAQHGPIVDFLYYQKFVATVRNPNPSPNEPRQVPAQPNLSMKGRTPEALLRAMNAWHVELGRARITPKTATWAPSQRKPFIYEEGQGENLRVYEINELVGAASLIEEGKAMHHCVASYANACVAGRCSIWSFTVRDAFGNAERLATLEVDQRTNADIIVQARKKHNALPTPKELSILRRWRNSGGPGISSWVDR